MVGGEHEEVAELDVVWANLVVDEWLFNMTFDVVSLPHASLDRRCLGVRQPRSDATALAVCLAGGHILGMCKCWR